MGVCLCVPNFDSQKNPKYARIYSRNSSLLSDNFLSSLNSPRTQHRIPSCFSTHVYLGQVSPLYPYNSLYIIVVFYIIPHFVLCLIHNSFKLPMSLSPSYEENALVKHSEFKVLNYSPILFKI